MSTVIIACDVLRGQLETAQKNMGTAYPVIWLDRNRHLEPKEMRADLDKVMATLGQDVDTVLIVMGFCGGTLAGLSSDKKLVIPRVDDCITILMQTDDTYCANKKEIGHMYIFDDIPTGFSPEELYERTLRDHTSVEADMLFDRWFQTYSSLDIVDTGLYDCYDEIFVERMQKNAEMIHCELNFVEGSNRMLEKLVSGRWDEQFVVLLPGRKLMHGDFFS